MMADRKKGLKLYIGVANLFNSRATKLNLGES